MSNQVPEQEKHVIDVSRECYDEIRKALVAQGNFFTGIDRGTLGHVTNLGRVVVRTGCAWRR